MNAMLTVASIILYGNNTIKIKNNKLTEDSQITKGLGQGSSMSSTVFKVYLDRTLQGWQRNVET